MSDYWSVIDDIRTVLENTQSIYPEHREVLRRIARNYDDAVGEVNGRLRQAAQHMRKGNPGEALRLVETEPNLFDVFAILDFPERNLWEEVLAAFELPPASPFLRDIIRELAEISSQSAPLEPLLRKHRFLALALAPLPLRLATLREIAKQDPTNAAWIADIETYERERVLELRREVDAALRNPDVQELSQLEAELASPDWQIGRPESLLLSVQRELQSQKSSATIVSLRKLAEQLLSAHQERDLHRALPLRDSWRALGQQLSMPVPTELMRHVRPALDWLALDDAMKQRDRRFRHEIQRMEEALDRNATLDELLRIRDDAETAAEESGSVIPDDLEERLELRLTNFRNAAESQRKFLIVGGAIALVFVFSIIAVLIGRASRLQKVDSAVAEIRDVIKNHSPATRPKSFETLQKYRDPGNPFSKDPAVREELEELEKCLESD